MIIKGRARKDASALAKYLLKENDQQKVRLMDVRDSASPDLGEALIDWEDTARALTKGEKPLYHVQIRLAAGELLTREQWLHTVGKLETRLKLDNCPRAVVGHLLNGELHLHVAWSRLDPEREKLVHLSNDRKVHHAVAREAEIAFNLRQLNLDRDKPRDRTKDRERGTPNERDREYRQARRGGTTRTALEKLVSAAFTTADSPAAFDANLQRLGITLRLGDRRDYIIEHKGQVYNPVRFIPGMTAAKLREKMNGYTPPERRQGSGERAPVQRRAEGRQADYLAAKLPTNTQAATPRAANDPPRQPVKRQRRPPAPRLRPRLYYDDPGI